MASPYKSLCPSPLTTSSTERATSLGGHHLTVASYGITSGSKS